MLHILPMAMLASLRNLIHHPPFEAVEDWRPCQPRLLIETCEVLRVIKPVRKEQEQGSKNT